MIVRQLLTVIGIKADEAKIKRVTKNLEGLRSASVAIGAAAATVAGATFYMVQRVAAGGSKIDKFSKATGIGAQELQALRFAAEATGAEADVLSDALKDLQERTAKAATGSEEYAKIFKAMGISTRDSSGKIKGGAQVFLEMADGLKLLGSDAEKTRALMALLGDKGIKVGALLSRGSGGIQELMTQAKALGVVMDEDAIRASVEFTDSFNLLKASAEGLIKSLSVSLMPTIQEWISAIQNAVLANKELVNDGMKLARSAIEELSAVVLILLKVTVGAAQAAVALGTGLAEMWPKIKATIRLIGIFGLAGSVVMLQKALVTLAATAKVAIVSMATELFILRAEYMALLLTSAKAAIAFAWPFLFAGIVIGGLYLILEDFWTFLTSSGESAIGNLVDSWGVFGDLLKTARDFWTGFTTDTNTWGETLTKWVDMLLRTFDGFFMFLRDKLNEIMPGLGMLTNILPGGLLASASNLATGGDGLSGAFRSLTGSTPTPSVAAAGAGGNTINVGGPSASISVREGSGGTNLPATRRAMEQSMEEQSRRLAANLVAVKGQF